MEKIQLYLAGHSRLANKRSNKQKPTNQTKEPTKLSTEILPWQNCIGITGHWFESKLIKGWCGAVQGWLLADSIAAHSSCIFTYSFFFYLPKTVVCNSDSQEAASLRAAVLKILLLFWHTRNILVCV